MEVGQSRGPFHFQFHSTLYIVWAESKDSIHWVFQHHQETETGISVSHNSYCHSLNLLYPCCHSPIPILSFPHSLNLLYPYGHSPIPSFSGGTSADRTEAGWDPQGPSRFDLFQRILSQNWDQGHSWNQWVYQIWRFHLKQLFHLFVSIMQWRLVGNPLRWIKSEFCDL